MREGRYKWWVIGSIILFVLVLVYKAIFEPGSIINFQTVGGLLFLELVLFLAWRFEKRFFLVLLLVFLAAGTGTPLTTLWNSVRWFVLAFGAIAGMLIYLKQYRSTFGLFHLVAFFSCLSAFVSTMVSNLPEASAMKAVSLLLLFVYGAGGARIAILGDEKFMQTVLKACEVLVYFTCISYFVFKYEFFGNPNSLGAIMGTIAMPILFWGSLIADNRALRVRRYTVFLLALLLCLDSYSRASISAGIVSCGLLCIALRRYSLLVKGVVIVGMISLLVMTYSPLQSENKSDSVISTFVYKGKPEESLLASRKTPWDETISSIQQNPWFGTGFGTTLSTARQDQTEVLRSLAGTSREHGNSYLAVTEWVGLLGVIPFAGLILLIIRKVLRGFLQMRMSNATQLFIPVCAVVSAGLIGAFFEDWLFAPGSYLCVFFWSFAFMLPDLLPATLAANFAIPHEAQTTSWNSGYRVVMPAQ
ncbi:MAG TPA: O-antigen ligase family protein [Terriglobales bacterium]